MAAHLYSLQNQLYTPCGSYQHRQYRCGNHLLELLEWEGDEVPALRELVDALFDSPDFRKVSDVLDSFPSGLLTAAGLKEIRDELEIEESGLNSMDRIKQYFDLWVDGREGQYSDGSE